MSLFTSREIDGMPGFERIGEHSEVQFDAVSTDSRSLPAGALFVPLTGPRFDGHAFMGEALTRGATGALVSKVPQKPPGIPMWKVADTLTALGQLARFHRDRFSIPMLGLTGTSGKTTTKELLRSMFAKRSLLVNEGNLNNLIGVPQTLFGLGAQHAFGVLEMGMNQFGEISRLTQIVNPTVGMINNVGPGHLAGVGDLEGVLRAKTEMAREMRADAPLVLNADDPLLRRFGQGAQRRIVWFGLQVGSDVTARDIVDNGLDGSSFVLKAGAKEAQVSMRLPGEHNIRNALGAVAAALEMGLPFEEAAAGIHASDAFRMRTEILDGLRGSRIVNDCYNANPASMREALRLLQSSRSKGRIAAVLGDMLELGEQAERYHRELGEWLAAVKPDRVWIVGQWAPVIARAATGVDVRIVTDRLALAAEASAWLQAGDIMLVKGSRGMKLETLIEALTGPKSEP